MELKPIAVVKLLYKNKQENKEYVLEESAQGDGGYDAFMNAISKIASKISVTLPMLTDYTVNIPPGGKTDALVQCTITWGWENHKTFITRGVSPDQILAAIEATEKMLNIIALKSNNIE